MDSAESEAGAISDGIAFVGGSMPRKGEELYIFNAFGRRASIF